MAKRLFLSIAILALVSTAYVITVHAQSLTISGYSCPYIAEPSFPSPTDEDGEPPTSGRADPGQFTLAVECVVPSTIYDVTVELLNPNHIEGVTDYFIDDDNPKFYSALAAETHYFYWSIDKYQLTASLRGHQEQYRVKLTYDDTPGPGGTSSTVYSDTFTITGEQSASCKQNDLAFVQSDPPSVVTTVGETFTVMTKYRESSRSIFEAASQIYFDGTLLRLIGFDLYYYDSNGEDPGDLSLGLPGGWSQTWSNDTYLNETQMPGTLSRGDHWIAAYTFLAINPGVDTLVPYNQTRLSSHGNWKLDSGYIEARIEVVIKPPGELVIDKTETAVIDRPDPPVVGTKTIYELTVTVRNAGGNNVTGVNVTDEISPDVTFVSLGTPSEGAASHSAGTITWSGLDLGPDETEILRFQVSVTPTSTDPLDLNIAAGLHASGTDTATSITVEDDGDTTITVTPLAELRDVAAISQVPSPTKVTQGEQVVITVTVSNPGSVSESFDVTCYYGDNILIGTETVTVGPAGSTEVTFYWDTTGVSPGTYMITAWADSSRAIEEIDEGNNWCTYEADVEVVSRVVPPQPVGGEVYSVSKLGILAPWIAIGMAIIVGIPIFIRRRRT